MNADGKQDTYWSGIGVYRRLFSFFQLALSAGFGCADRPLRSGLGIGFLRCRWQRMEPPQTEDRGEKMGTARQ